MSDDSQELFRIVNKKPGLQIWTINVSLKQIKPLKSILLCITIQYFCCHFAIQNMKMAPVPAKAFGNFFEGDCYIILYVSTTLADFPRGHGVNERRRFLHHSDISLNCFPPDK